MEQMEMLWAYQQADMAADRMEKEIKRSPTRLKLVKCRDNCLEQQEAYKRTDSEMAAMADRLDALKDAISMTEEQLKSLQAKVEQGSDSLELVSSFIADARRLLNNLNSYEQETKRIRKDAQDRERLKHDIKVRYAKYKAEFDRLKAEYDTEYKSKSGELEQLRAAAKEKAVGISDQLMERYRVIKLHSVPPLARLNNFQCGGCNMAVPSAVVRNIKSGQLVECETCGRLLLP